MWRLGSKRTLKSRVLHKFEIHRPDEATLSRYLEAYLLWLFGWLLFCNAHDNSVDKTFVPYARVIVDG
jgi:hypothetical protein